MMPCPRCLQRGETYVAGNRIARPCPSCEGKGFISEPMATQDDADREIEALRKRVAELEAAARLCRARVCSDCCSARHVPECDAVSQVLGEKREAAWKVRGTEVATCMHHCGYCAMNGQPKCPHVCPKCAREQPGKVFARHPMSEWPEELR